ncbi:Mu transposase domain-containing protein [Heyndrickxia sporothermodurans]
MVYDQDSVIVVSENGGNLIYTKEFEVYRQQRGLKVRICRKADPESKGRIENVVGYIKKNFAKHRIFTNIDRWNEDSWKWLNRTGNYKIHQTTKKRPVEVFQEEKHHLRPVPNPLEFSNVKPVSSITRTVRRDNTIRYQSNRYSVPLGTFNKQEKVYIQRTEEHLLIYASPNGPLMAEHKICHGKGQLIQDRQHTRDRSKGIDAYMDTVASYFTDSHLAQCFLKEIRDRYPRYIRDQLQIIMNQLKRTPQEISNQALEECVDKRLFCATDFVDMIQYIKRQRPLNVTDVRNEEGKIKPFHGQNAFIIQTYAQKRDVNEYIAVLEGEK